MSLTEILESLRNLSVEERQQVVSKAIHLDEPALEHELDEEDGGVEITEEEKRILDERWQHYLANPETALTLDQLKALMSARRKK